MRSHSLVSRMIRAIKLDASLYEEVKADTTANGQAFLAVVFAGLATGIGAGIAGVFKLGGVWSIWFLLIGLISSIIWWLAWSFFAYFIGTKVFKGPETSDTMRELLRTIGFSISPGVLGILSVIPVLGGIILLGVFIWVLVAGLIAVRQALDFTTGRAIVTCLATWLACVLIAVLVITLLSAYLFGGRYTLGNSFDSRLNSIVGLYRFNIVAWEITTFSHELSQWTSSRDETA
ncbi:YIP1 family protein, partial [Chloroflexota bacterium]